MDNKWILNIDGSIIEYNDFDAAVKGFKAAINAALDDEKFFDSADFTPFPLGAFISYKYDKDSISDEEIVVSTRVSLLMSSLCWEDARVFKTRPSPSLGVPILTPAKMAMARKLKGLTSPLKKRGDEISLNITQSGGGMRLSSSAFSIGNPALSCYFHCEDSVNEASACEKCDDSMHSYIVLAMAC